MTIGQGTYRVKKQNNNKKTKKPLFHLFFIFIQLNAV